jgi:hypothetical protein
MIPTSLQISVIALLALTSAVCAQLGATVEQCKARYGDAFIFKDGSPQAPVTIDQSNPDALANEVILQMLPANWGIVRKDGWTKGMQFSDGKCVMLTVAKEPRGFGGSPPPLSAEEIKAVLDGVIGADRYKRVQAGVNDTFVSNDGRIAAEYNLMGTVTLRLTSGVSE